MKRLWLVWFVYWLGTCSVMADTASERMRQHQINFVTSSPPVDFDPAHIRTYSQKIILKSVYQTLVEVVRGHHLGPGLAHWLVDEENTAYVFHIHPKARFEDGQPVLAEDVAWSLSRHFWPSTQSGGKMLLQNLKGNTTHVPEGQTLEAITILDPHTVRIAIKKFSSGFLENLASAYMSILPHKKFDPMHPVSSGPMIAKQDPKTGYWTLSPNPKYMREPTAIRKMVILPVHSRKKMQKLLAQNKVDILPIMPIGIENSLFRGLKVQKLSAWKATHLFFNRDKVLFAEKHFRRDLSILIQNAMQVFNSQQENYTLLNTYMPEGVLPAHYYKTTLPQALTPEDFKQKWKNKRGKITILNTFGQLDKKVQEVITQALKKVGLETKWIWRAHNKNHQILKNREYDLFLQNVQNLSLPPNGLIVLQYPNHPMRMTHPSIQVFFKNMRMASAIEEQVPRAFAYARAYRAFEDEYEFIPLLQSSSHPMMIRSEMFEIPIANLEPVLSEVSWK